MPRVISASEAKNRLGSAMDWVLQNGDEIIIENHGTPSVVLIPFAEYETMKRLREQERRREALEQLRVLREEVRAQNQDITTDEQAMEIADRFVREVIDDMIAEGKIKYQGEA